MSNQETPATLPEFRASPVEAVKSYLHADEWVENLLWLSVSAISCAIIVGYIPLFGYGAELIERRSGRPDFPRSRIDSERIGDYFGKGIWPLAVAAVFYCIAGPILSLIYIPFYAVAGMSGDDEIMLIVTLITVPISMLLSLAFAFLATTFIIRAMITQEFSKSFDLQWSKHFIQVMWLEMLISGIVFGLVCTGLYIVGFLACCIGYIPAMGLGLGALVHLYAQWYEIYLSRGGIPVPPKEESIIEATIV